MTDVPRVSDMNWGEQAERAKVVPFDGRRTSAEAAGDARRWLTVTEAVAEPMPEPVIEGVAWSDCLTTMSSESGTGKTFVVLDQLAAVSADLPWHGRRVQHGAGVYIGYEGHAGIRLRALREVGGHWLRDVYVLPGVGPLSPTVDRGRAEMPSTGELDIAEQLDGLTAFLRGESRPAIRLVVVDTLRASLAGSEDTSENVAAYLRAIRRLMRHTPGAGWLVLHHAGWQDGQQAKRRERGSSSLRGDVDAALYLEAAGEYDRERGEARLTLTALKVRDEEHPAPLHLVRRRVEIPGLADRWGQPVTSCLIASDARTREEREAETRQAAAAETRALDLRILRALQAHPEISSKFMLRAYVAVSEAAVAEGLLRVIAAGWTGGKLWGRSRDVESKYLLTSFARCGVCGGSLYVKSRSHGRQRAFYYGCMSFHKRGAAVCSNNVEIPLDAFNEAVLGKLADEILRTDVVEAAVLRTIAARRPAARAKLADKLRSELASLDGELGRLAEAIAVSGALPALLEAVQGRQQRRQEVAVQLETVEASVPTFDVEALRGRIDAKLADWKALLGRRVEWSRQMFRKLLSGPLTVTPLPEGRGFHFTGKACYGKLLEAVCAGATNLASPTGRQVLCRVPLAGKVREEADSRRFARLRRR